MGDGPGFGTRFGHVLLMVLLFLAVFGEALFSDRAIYSIDFAPVARPDFGSRLWESGWGNWEEDVLGVGVGGWPLHPTRLLLAPLPFLLFRTMVYIAGASALIGAAWYFLRGCGYRGWTALAPALGLGFSGYVFTLIAAGHPSMPEVMACAVFALACTDRAIRSGQAFHFAAAGGCVALGLSAQPDVMVLFLLVIGAFAVLRLCQGWRRGAGRRGAFARRILLGAVVGALFFGGIGLPMFRNMFTRVLPGRESVRGQTPEQNWEFATNWSMPPEEILELVAPCVYGVETADAAAPYWGRLGRTLGWRPGSPGLRNLKQHTLYMGVLQLLFSAYAIAWALRRRGSADAADAATEPAAADSMRGEWTPPRRVDVFFWGTILVLGVLLALGRYFPLYRVFYAMPYLSKIRCPVKLLHWAEVATCCLFAAGLSAFLSDLAAGRTGSVTKTPAKRPAGGALDASAADGRTRGVFAAFAIGAAACAVALLIGMSAAGSSADRLMAYWRSIGFGEQGESLMRTMKGAMGHGAALFIVGGGVFACAAWGRRRGWIARWAAGALATVMAIDLAVVARKYVNLVDVSPIYAANPVAARIREGAPGRTSFRLSQPTAQNWVWCNFAYHHRVEMLEPRMESGLSDEYRAYFGALAGNALRLWQLTNTRYIVGGAEDLKSLMRHPAFEVLMRFGLARGMFVQTADSGGPGVLLGFRGALPRALLYHSWRNVEPDAALALLASEEWNPGRTALVTGALPARTSERTPTEVRIENYRRTKVVVRTDAPEEGLLLLNDRYDPDWRVRIDGRLAPLLRCNYIVRGVAVPAGKHTVVFSYRPCLAVFLAGLGSLLCLGAWLAARVAVRLRAARRGRASG